MRFREVRVIGSDGQQLGVLPVREALDIAQEQGLDLVLVAPNASPVVCRIVDFGKYKYEQDKIKKESKKKKKQEIKGIKLRPGTGDHDLNHLLKKAISFLEDGDKVRFQCVFRKRELAHPEVGKAKLDVVIERLEPFAKVERTPTMNGKDMIMVVAPKPASSKKSKSDAEEVSANASEEAT